MAFCADIAKLEIFMPKPIQRLGWLTLDAVLTSADEAEHFGMYRPSS